MQSKLPAVGTTIFTVMTVMAQKHGAINLAQGFPDFDCPDRLKELVNHHLCNGKNQYPHVNGIAELRREIARKVEEHYGYAADAEQEVTVTSGATEALFDAIHATVGPGDEVIMFDPAYDCYDPAVVLAGGRAVHIPLKAPQGDEHDDWYIDWDQVKDAITDRTRLIMINSPHNPCGNLLGKDDLDRLAALIRERDILVLSDEVYEHIVFDGHEHNSVLSHPELKKKSFAVFSFGKTYHVTGWKLAYCVAPVEMSREFRKVHQFVTFTTSSFVQYAVADFMAECPQHAHELPEFYQIKRDFFCERLAQSRFSFTPTRGTYFQLADYSAISDLPDMEFTSWLAKEKGVAAIPLTPFCETPPSTRFVRFCFSKDDSTLEAATSLLKSL